MPSIPGTSRDGKHAASQMGRAPFRNRPRVLHRRRRRARARKVLRCNRTDGMPAPVHRGRPSMSGRACDSLSTENDVEAGEQQVNLRPRDPACTKIEQRAIEGDDLGHVRDRVSRQTRHSGRQQYVARRIRPPQIACERYADHRGQPASIQGVSLNDDHRPAKPGPRAGGWRQLGPADVTLGDHHSTRSSTRRAAAERKASSYSPTSSHTRFIVSVISSFVWRATYSASAVAYTSLRERCSRRARHSARSKMSSGIDTAVFMPAV